MKRIVGVADPAASRVEDIAAAPVPTGRSGGEGGECGGGGGSEGEADEGKPPRWPAAAVPLGAWRAGR